MGGAHEPRGACLGPGAALATLALPDGLTTIGRDAFHSCSSLALTELPSKLDWIDPFAFYECKSLALTEIAVENILKGAFLCCTALAPKAITCDVLYIGRAAFRGCTSLGRIELWRDCDDNCNLEIEPIAFMDCKKLDMSLDVFRCCPEGMRNCDVHSSAFDNTNETMQRRLTSLFDWWNQQGCPQTLRTWDWDSSSDEEADVQAHCSGAARCTLVALLGWRRCSPC